MEGGLLIGCDKTEKLVHGCGKRGRLLAAWRGSPVHAILCHRREVTAPEWLRSPGAERNLVSQLDRLR
jgi:hypothetical protein